MVDSLGSWSSDAVLAVLPILNATPVLNQLR